nr:proline-rich protein 36 isoform X1 [Aegilops tauschii subsp. strangulata]
MRSPPCPAPFLPHLLSLFLSLTLLSLSVGLVAPPWRPQLQPVAAALPESPSPRPLAQLHRRPEPPRLAASSASPRARSNSPTASLPTPARLLLLCSGRPRSFPDARGRASSPFSARSQGQPPPCRSPALASRPRASLLQPVQATRRRAPVLHRSPRACISPPCHSSELRRAQPPGPYPVDPCSRTRNFSTAPWPPSLRPASPSIRLDLDGSMLLHSFLAPTTPKSIMPSRRRLNLLPPLFFSNESSSSSLVPRVDRATPAPGPRPASRPSSCILSACCYLSTVLG